MPKTCTTDTDSQIALADFDGDGDLDILSKHLWTNDGTGRFEKSTEVVSIDPYSYGVNYVTGDVNGDGDIDIIGSSGVYINQDVYVTAFDDLPVELHVGRQLNFQVRVSNFSRFEEGAEIEFDHGDTLRDITWTCTATGHATCTTVDNGDFAEIHLPTESQLVFDVTATVDRTLIPGGVVTWRIGANAMDSDLVYHSVSRDFRVLPLSITPDRNSHTIDRRLRSVVTRWAGDFDPSTVSAVTVIAHGVYSGQVPLVISSNESGFDIDAVEGLFPGERVMVTAGSRIATTDESTSFDGMVWEYRVNSAPSRAVFVGGPTLPTQPQHLADIDNDGDLDGFAGKTVLINHDGTFVAVSESRPADVLGTFDANGDGNVDVIVADDQYLMYGDGNGHFTQTDIAAFNKRIGEVAIGDFDADGDQDIVATIVHSPSLPSMFFRNDENGFINVTLSESLHSPLSLGDLDGDGDLDVTSSNRILHNDGHGNFAISLASTGANVGDLDGDGALDMFTNYRFLRNDGFGHFESQYQYSLPYPDTSELFDADGDGDLDILMQREASPNGIPVAIELWRNDGDFVFRKQQELPTDGLTIVTGDLDLDGDLDVIAGSRIWWNESPLVGDASLDGAVDGVDFGIWQENRFQTNASWLDGDFTQDGTVDGSDFNLWNMSKFTMPAANDLKEIARTPRAALPVHQRVIAIEDRHDSHESVLDRDLIAIDYVFSSLAKESAVQRDTTLIQPPKWRLVQMTRRELR